MFTIKTLNEISPVGLAALPEEQYTISSTIEQPDAILLRSASMHDLPFPASLLAIGRAGAGVNNIPLERCTEAGIAVFNTPGANANAVKELVLASLLLASRDIVGGITWASTLGGQTGVAKLVETEKSRFGGNEIYGKTLGVMGLGAIGVLVANAASDLGMEVLGADPYISIESAWNLHPSVKKVNSYENLTNCDFISVHIPLLEDTKNIINAEYLKTLKPGTTLLNFSRGELVDNAAVIAALADGQLAHYITDFPMDDSVGIPGIIAIPHLGASTEESEENCARMAAREVRHYLEFGNIVNSVNLPDCVLPYTGKTRLTIVYKNIPTSIAKLLEGIASAGVNINNMINKSRGDISYTIIDLDGEPNEEITSTIEALDEVIRLRVIS